MYGTYLPPIAGGYNVSKVGSNVSNRSSNEPATPPLAKRLVSGLKFCLHMAVHLNDALMGFISVFQSAIPLGVVSPASNYSPRRSSGNVNCTLYLRPLFIV